MTEKYKIWDNQEKKWFRPEYPGSKYDGKKGKPVDTYNTREILFSQSGELFSHEVLDGVRTMNHIPCCDEDGPEVARFIPCVYTGVKDDNEVKAYLNDIVRSDDLDGVIIFEAGCFKIFDHVSGISIPLGFHREGRRRSFTITGNMLEYKASLKKATDNQS